VRDRGATWVHLRRVDCASDAQMIEFELRIWRRRPDLNRGWRFCRFGAVVYLLAGLVFWYRVLVGFPWCLGVNGPEFGPKFPRDSRAAPPTQSPSLFVNHVSLVPAGSFLPAAARCLVTGTTKLYVTIARSGSGTYGATKRVRFGTETALSSAEIRFACAAGFTKAIGSGGHDSRTWSEWLALIVDPLRLLRLTFRSRARLAAEHLFLRKPLAC
jgi:hypothetical protein